MSKYEDEVRAAVLTLKHGEYVIDGYAIYYVEKLGDVPVLKRVDDSKVHIITNVRGIPLGVSMLLFHGEQVA